LKTFKVLVKKVVVNLFISDMDR